jgi:alanine dehydrogenase
MAGSTDSIANMGVPREINTDEQRVALTPNAVRELVAQGLVVRVVHWEGGGAGISDGAVEWFGTAVVDREEALSTHLVVKLSGWNFGRGWRMPIAET